MYFNESRLKVLRECPYKYNRMYVDRVRPESEDMTAYEVGIFWHELMEKYYKEGHEKAALFIINQEIIPGNFTKNWWIYTLDKYHAEYGIIDVGMWDVIDTERVLTIPPKPSEDKWYGFIGRADLIVRDKSTGFVVFVQHKTMSPYTDVGGYVSQYRMQPHDALYMRAWNETAEARDHVNMLVLSILIKDKGMGQCQRFTHRIDDSAQFDAEYDFGAWAKVVGHLSDYAPRNPNSCASWPYKTDRNFCPFLPECKGGIIDTVKIENDYVDEINGKEKLS